jgi:hypothetical protein
MAQYIRLVEGIVPSTFSIDLNDISQEQGPFWVFIDYWLHTTDLSNSSGFQGIIKWIDPTGGELSLIGTVVPLNAALLDVNGSSEGSHNQTRGLVAARRQSGSSPFHVDFELLGSAGASLISYMIMLQKEQAFVEW